MAETCTPLLRLEPGDEFVANDRAYVITEKHSHSDLLRYIVEDIGVDHAMALLRGMKVPSHARSRPQPH